eukprot:8242147-Heterocapsa_arctica.AAC.1
MEQMVAARRRTPRRPKLRPLAGGMRKLLARAKLGLPALIAQASSDPQTTPASPLAPTRDKLHNGLLLMSRFNGQV